MLLREHNRQRDKTITEKLREELVTTDPEQAYVSLLAERAAKVPEIDNRIVIRGEKKRSRISKAKMPMVQAAIAVINARRQFWPLSVRSVHYRVAQMESPPLRHASKPASRYVNDDKSYKDLVKQLTAARLEGLVPLTAIGDETRPVTTWGVYPNPRLFMAEQIDGFLKGYFRNLVQGQPAHIEIVAEKNTIFPVLRPVASEYCIAISSGRGYSSLPPRAGIVDRFRASGADTLVLLYVSDFDPEGEDMNHSFARSIRDDFGLDDDEIMAFKVALTRDQIDEYGVPLLKIKEGSSRRAKFVAQHGDKVAEVDALQDDVLQNLLRNAIDSVIDCDLFNEELLREKQDAAQLHVIRREVHEQLQAVNFDDLDDFGEDDFDEKVT